MNINQDICCGVSPLEKKLLKEVQEHVSDLLPQGGLMHFKKGHAIFYEGHHPLGFYVLKKGEIVLSRTTMEDRKEDLPNGSQELFGLFHLLTNTPHCATATAQNDVEVFFVPKSVVLDFLKGREL